MDELEIIFRMLAGTACGMAIGIDRDLRGKQAGLRTLGLVGLGASVVAVTVASDPVFAANADAMSRVVQGVIQGVLAGVGFIGAGVVLHDSKAKAVYGLTTAAAVWLVAALGIAAGLGAWRVVATGVVVGLVLLGIMHYVERWVSPGDGDKKNSVVADDEKPDKDDA
ncbi:Protein SrpB [Alphaproteobacteria bacterium SO-S41]|nr:Protein SrpB [Alphaproteobacteria bacterium SO-S41]